MTVIEWLNTIKDPTMRLKAIVNMYPGQQDVEEDTLSEALASAFDWSVSTEGLDFWADFQAELGEDF
jgi:hypothetical protein